ncbi:hypothetical protein BKA69DRAFT_1038949 [Paraphysoderma sedebokerense]|nr:hypothetical protein BKA69DRAFT_1038949 [Paraphysoderma sedebokerense]
MKPESKSSADIHFSQITINEDFTSGDIVSKWEDRPLYTIPILVCQFDNSTITTYNNRRLYACRQHNPSKNIACYIYNANSIIEENNPYRNTSGFMIWKAERVIENRNNLGVFILHFQVNTYGALIAFRCALQADTFPVQGRTELPQVSSNAGPKSHQSISIPENEALQIFKNAGEIYIGRNLHNVHPHLGFMQFVNSNRGSLAFISCVFIPNGSIVLKPQGDIEEDWDEFETDAMKSLLEIDDELEDEWIEYMDQGETITWFEFRDPGVEK